MPLKLYILKAWWALCHLVHGGWCVYHSLTAKKQAPGGRRCRDLARTGSRVAAAQTDIIGVTYTSSLDFQLRLPKFGRSRRKVMKQRQGSWFILLPKKQNSLGTRAPYTISVNHGPVALWSLWSLWSLWPSGPCSVVYVRWCSWLWQFS